VKTLKALKKTGLEYESEQSFSFNGRWTKTKNKKTVNRLQKETLQSFVLTNFICYPLNKGKPLDLL